MKPITKQIRAERRAKAEKIQAAYQALSLEQKIARLPEIGAKRQRVRLGVAIIEYAKTIPIE